jgi:Integrase zinc binding domain
LRRGNTTGQSACNTGKFANTNGRFVNAFGTCSIQKGKEFLSEDPVDEFEKSGQAIELESMSLPEQSEIAHKRDVLVDNFFRDVQKGYLEDIWVSKPHHVAGLRKEHELLWRGSALVIPKYNQLRESILYMHHDAPWAGHLGWRRTVTLLSESYWWPGMSSDVEDYVASCHSCQRNKSTTKNMETHLAPLPVPSACWRTVGFDLIPSLPTTKSGFDSICVFVDHFSKMVRLVP